MARKRKDHNDNKLPTRVSKNKYSYYLKTKDNKTIILGPLTMSMIELWAKYDGEIANQKIIMTFSKLWGMHLSSPAFTELSARSQKDKLQGAKNILKVFGHINADNIKPEHIRQYMDIRGTQSKTQANHELSYMSVAFGWGYERGYCKRNPCSGIKKFSTPIREKYITDEEYQVSYDVSSPIVKIAMEISYLCASRIGDILKLKHNQISEQGIYIRQGKTGVKQIKKWTDRLQASIDYAIKLFPPGSKESYVIINTKGNKFTKSGFDNHWNETKIKASEILGRKLISHFMISKLKQSRILRGAQKTNNYSVATKPNLK